VGGKYAVNACDRSTGMSVSPRVIIAFYTESGTKWGAAVRANTARQGILYPSRVYWDWGALAAYLFPTRYIFPGICVLADGYWPSIRNTNIGWDESDIPESRWPGLYGKGGLENMQRGESVPPGCDGVWRVLLIPSAHSYDARVQSYTFAGAIGLLATFDASLVSASEVSQADKRWAYEELTKLVEAQLKVEQDSARRSTLTEWARKFRGRVNACK